jgi:hypothetical protein
LAIVRAIGLGSVAVVSQYETISRPSIHEDVHMALLVDIWGHKFALRAAK